MIGELGEIFRIPQQDFRQELAAHEQLDQNLDRPRIRSQIAEQAVAVVHALHEPLEIDQRTIRRRGIGQGMQQHRQGFAERLAAGLILRHPPQPPQGFFGMLKIHRPQ